MTKPLPVPPIRPGRRLRAAGRALLATLLLAAALALPLAPTPARAATHEVVIAGYAYGPATLTVSVGDTVTWTNQDTAPHDVLTTAGPVTVDSPMLEQGDQWSYTFTTPGTYDYYCTVHPDMTARVVVEPAPDPTTRAPAPAPEPEPEDHGGGGHDEHESEPAPTSAPPETEHETEPEPDPTTDTDTETEAEPTESGAHAHDASPTPASPTEVAVEPAAAEERLDPLLLVTGAVAGIAVLCLLLVGSRTAAARQQTPTDAD
ncbi:cupredoxin domain-containing protein [Streptomyces millisiae]|uniref:Cupredoxin family copper-binding protein n=1 Tax=Streptomyces millisiae TaxID=3075542 RepID=A0ABU2LYH9_9ACTN|nr:cupredoxin family copper-binding protein [Streptomyces sp. DSM 44918]MDT0322656.1 cupredoxin family copper-binding protein [Streptomyces sp. DSM 44918]